MYSHLPNLKGLHKIFLINRVSKEIVMEFAVVVVMVLDILSFSVLIPHLG